MVDTSITEEEIKAMFLDQRRSDYLEHLDVSGSSAKPSEEEENFYHYTNRALELFTEQIAFACVKRIAEHKELNGKPAWYKNTWNAIVDICKDAIDGIGIADVRIRENDSWQWKSGIVTIEVAPTESDGCKVPKFAEVCIHGNRDEGMEVKNDIPKYGVYVDVSNTRWAFGRCESGDIGNAPARPTATQLFDAVTNAEHTIKQIDAIRHKYAVMIDELRREMHAEADPIANNAASTLGYDADCGQYGHRVNMAASNSELEYEVNYRVR
jgi:hypothetical protein